MTVLPLGGRRREGCKFRRKRDIEIIVSECAAYLPINIFNKLLGGFQLSNIVEILLDFAFKRTSIIVCYRCHIKPPRHGKAQRFIIYLEVVLAYQIHYIGVDKSIVGMTDSFISGAFFSEIGFALVSFMVFSFAPFF